MKKKIQKNDRYIVIDVTREQVGGIHEGIQTRTREVKKEEGQGRVAVAALLFKAMATWRARPCLFQRSVGACASSNRRVFTDRTALYTIQQITSKICRNGREMKVEIEQRQGHPMLRILIQSIFLFLTINTKEDGQRWMIGRHGC